MWNEGLKAKPFTLPRIKEPSKSMAPKPNSEGSGIWEDFDENSRDIHERLIRD